MIVTRLVGGIGNQLFNYAVGRCLAHRHNTALKMDPTSCIIGANSHHEFYKLGAFNIQENFATLEEIQQTHLVQEKMSNGYPIVFTPEVLDAPDNSYLYGSYGNEKYFIEIEDIIRREFTLKNPLGKNSAAWKEKILSANCAVSLHFRRGDYYTYNSRNLRGLLPLNYYQAGIDALRKDFSDIMLFIFSDDLQWCKENLKFDVPTEFVEGCEHDYEELYLMSCCKHNVISNGTFGWWGAWLNPNPDKKVFAPTPFLRNLDADKNIPESWIKIPADYSLVTPMLSIIVYVENNLDTINLLMTCIVLQNFNDYEVIFIDASTDGSGALCRKISVDKKFTTLNVEPATNKFSAWNKALAIARGDYVLFLTAKDFLFQNAVKNLSIVCDNALYGKANFRESYITYKNFSDYTPDIICTTQSIYEDENGTYQLTGMEDKKFSISSDSAFSDLKRIIEPYISPSQKLLALGTNSINNLVGTKFFKRQFLDDNNIRFQNGGGYDVELTFVVETFLKTEKISFAPILFYGRFK